MIVAIEGLIPDRRAGSAQNNNPPLRLPNRISIPPPGFAGSRGKPSTPSQAPHLSRKKMSLTSPSPNPLPARRKTRLRPPAPPALSLTPAASRTARSRSARRTPGSPFSIEKEPICPAPLSYTHAQPLQNSQKTSNFIEFYGISTERIPLERAKRLRRTCLGFVARHDFESGRAIIESMTALGGWKRTAGHPTESVPKGRDNL